MYASYLWLIFLWDSDSIESSSSSKKWLLHPSILGGFQDGLAFRYLVLLPDHVFSFYLQKIWSMYHFIAGAIASSFRSDLVYHLMVQPCWRRLVRPEKAEAMCSTSPCNTIAQLETVWFEILTEPLENLSCPGTNIEFVIPCRPQRARNSQQACTDYFPRPMRSRETVMCERRGPS